MTKTQSETTPVVFVTNSLQTGGSERNLVVLSNGLPANVTREIWSFKLPEKNSFETSCRVRYFTRLIKFDPVLIIRLAWIMAFHPARVFHIYHFAFGAHVLLANLLLFRSKKLVFSFGSGRDEISKSVFKIYASLINRFADCVTSNSESTSLDLVRDGIQADKIQIVENGHELDSFHFHQSKVELRRTLGLSTTATLILTTGRLVETKRTKDLIDAFAMLPVDGTERKLIIVGDGSLRHSLEALARKIGVEDLVSFVGQKTPSEVKQYLAVADVFAFPSETEGSPNSLIEASLAKLPIVACRVGGVIDVVEHKATGLLVEKHNPQAMATAISALANDREFADSLALEAYRRAKSRFGSDRMTSRFLEIYESVQ